MDTLYANNDHVIELQDLRDVDGTLITAATVTAILYEPDGVTEVAGVTWPITLDYTGARGTYRGEIPAGADVIPGGRYKLHISAVYGGKQYAVTRTVRVEERYT